jgi:Circadian oscillating protein COP23
MKSLKILLAFSLWITPLLLTTFLSSASSKLNYKFLCGYSFQANTYATQIEFPNDKKYDMIYWKKSSNPRKKCEDISSKFQDFQDNRRLNYLLAGKSSTGQSIICGVAKHIESCNDSNKIFTLLPGTNPQSAIEGLTETILGGNNPILQGSDDEIIVKFEDLIANIRQKQETETGKKAR